ncbi:MAG TPA: hypothetical protein VGD43_19645, partial [Micromonospora sp.]
ALRQHRRRALLLVPAALPLVLVLATTGAVADRESPGDRVICVEGATALCIWPEHEKYLPQLREVNARIELLPDAFVLPPRINQFGIAKARAVLPDGTEYVNYEVGGPVFNIIEGSPWSYASQIGIGIISSTFGFTDQQNCRWPEQTPPDQARLWAVGAWMEAFLVGQSTPDYHTNAPAEMQAAWSKGRAVARNPSLAEQFSWVEGEVGDLRGRYCQSGR